MRGIIDRFFIKSNYQYFNRVVSAFLVCDYPFISVYVRIYAVQQYQICFEAVERMVSDLRIIQKNISSGIFYGDDLVSHIAEPQYVAQSVKQCHGRLVDL